MSTDSTELTFVRCPSCRSLVPAVSTRCRMCGAALDPTAAGANEPTPKTGGRVRQRTMSSQADSELAAATEQIREDEGVSMEAGGVADEGVEEVPFDDPLSAYIEEVEVLDEGADDFSSDDDDDDDEPALDAAPEVAEPAEPEPEESFHLEPEPEPAPTTNEAAEPEQAHEPDTESESESATPADQPAPQVRVEHGARGRTSGGLSFSKTAAAETEEPEIAEPEVEEPEETPEPIEARQEPVEEEDDDSDSFQEEEEREEEVTEPEPVQESRASRAAAKKPKAASPAVAGRLFGWLVTYSSPEGDAIELREGRFFVTSSSLKASDLILEDESVSTPHAMVSVGVDSGLMVQDLMSERGVFVRRKDSGAYTREPEPVEVENGDWIRFGDVEFLVSLIPYVGEV